MKILVIVPFLLKEAQDWVITVFNLGFFVSQFVNHWEMLQLLLKFSLFSTHRLWTLLGFILMCVCVCVCVCVQGGGVMWNDALHPRSVADTFIILNTFRMQIISNFIHICVIFNILDTNEGYRHARRKLWCAWKERIQLIGQFQVTLKHDSPPPASNWSYIDTFCNADCAKYINEDRW